MNPKESTHRPPAVPLGRLDHARKNLEAARAANYRTGLFEEPIDRSSGRWTEGAGGRGQGRGCPRGRRRCRRGRPRRRSQAAYREAKPDNTGDWIAARQQFNIARDGGYKAGLFEDSPQKYLERMDKKEAADNAKTMAEIERAREATRVADAVRAAEAAAPPVTPRLPRPSRLP